MLRALDGIGRRLMELGLVVGVLAAGLSIFGAAAGTVRFHDDESSYIRASRYFSYLFVHLDARHEDWDDAYTHHTRGIVPGYLIGGWLWARGYPVEALRVRVFEGQLPNSVADELPLDRVNDQLIDTRLVHQARVPMVLVGAAAIGVLYLLGRVLAGPSGGLTMAILGLASPLSQRYLGQARSEPALAFFMFLTLLLAVVGARRGGDGRLPLGWALACGVALGLALGSKHTALLSLAALVLWGLLVAWSAWRVDAGSFRTRLISGWRAGQGWLLAAAVGFGIFVLSNPHFYLDPPLHLWHVVEARRQVILDHQETQSRQAVHSRLERARLVFGRALTDDTASGSRGVPLEAALVPLGAAVLLLNTLRGLRTGRPPVDGLILLTVAAYFVGVSAGLYVDWERYFLPTLLVGNILSGIGLAAVFARLTNLWLALWCRRRGASRPIMLPGD